MNSQLLRTFGMMVVIMSLITVRLSASEPILIGKGIDAKWSPDEKYVSYLRGDAFVVNSIDEGIKKEVIFPAPIFSYEWLTDSSLVFMERKYYDAPEGRTRLVRISTITLTGRVLTSTTDSTNLDNATRDYLPIQRFIGGRVGYIVASKSVSELFSVDVEGNHHSFREDSTGNSLYVKSFPYPWGPVWLFATQGGMLRQLTTGNAAFLLPQLSPSGTMFTCSATNGDLLVFDTLGTQLCNLGLADFPVWSSDSRLLAFCRTEESEYDVIASDIFIAPSNCSGLEQLTDTPDEVELEPRFSPTTRMLLYRAHPSNNLYILSLKAGD